MKLTSKAGSPLFLASLLLSCSYGSCFAQNACTSPESVTLFIENSPTLKILDQTINLALKEKQNEYCNWVKQRDSKFSEKQFDKIGFSEFHQKCDATKEIAGWHIAQINKILPNSCEIDVCYTAKANLDKLPNITVYNGQYAIKQPGVSIRIDEINDNNPIRLITFNGDRFDSDCGAMDLQLLFIGNYPNDKSSSINQAIDKSLAKNYLDIKYTPLHANKLANKLFLDHEYHHSYSEEPQFEDEQYFSYSQLFSHYTGGAHGNHSLTHININKKTGEIVKLSDLLDEKYKEQILSIAKNNLYSHYKLDTNKSLNEHGFWFSKGEAPKEAGVWVDENGFYLPDNFLLQPDGIVFNYQPYEVAPYAMGMPQTEVLWQELDDIGR